MLVYKLGRGVFFAFAALALASPVQSTSFDCPSRPLSEHIGEVKLIFVGRLVAEVPDPKNPDLTISTLNVSARWKGPALTTVKIVSNQSFPSPFSGNGLWLVYARNQPELPPGHFMLPYCPPGAKPVEAANADLEVLGKPVWRNSQ
jgi:hypothetical protein